MELPSTRIEFSSYYYRERGRPLSPGRFPRSHLQIRGRAHRTVRNFGDEGLASLPVLPRLRFLILATTQVTEAGLAQLDKFPNLEYVGLHNLRISDEALARLKAARPNLTIAR